MQVRTRVIILFKPNVGNFLLWMYGLIGFWHCIFNNCWPERAGGLEVGAGRQGIAWAGLLLAAANGANGQAAVASHTVAPVRSGLAASLQRHTFQD